MYNPWTWTKLRGRGMPEGGGCRAERDKEEEKWDKCNSMISKIFFKDKTMQSTLALSCGLPNHLNSFHGKCSSLMSNVMQIFSCVAQSFWMWWPHSTYSHSTGVCWYHWLVQWSCHCSCMHILVPSPYLPGYTDVTETILVMLTLAGRFPGRPHIVEELPISIEYPLTFWLIFTQI